MVFRAKVDGIYISFISIVVIVIGIVLFFPLFIEDVPLLAVFILTSIFLIVIGFMIWTSFSIQYIFHEDHLLIKGGPFRSRIPFGKITKVSPTTATFTGHSMASARDALEIFNQTTFMGSIKISPEDKIGFLDELVKRCPNMQIESLSNFRDDR